MVLKAETDTLHFDTVFTSTGSVTRSFKIYNSNKRGVQISSILLKGGTSSPFKINVNGVTGPSVLQTQVNSNDSVYVFVSVKIDPTTANMPFIIRDSIEVEYNGNRKVIQLQAYGQNAHFLRKHIVASDETWTNDLPYVVLGGLEVAANATLTIQKGCRVFLHADAPLLINGTLHVLGEKYDSTRVIFTGDRLDEPYRNYPASWPGIYFNPSSRNNIINYAEIKNAYQALVVQAPSFNSTPKLLLSETKVDNAYDAGILALNSSINAQNVLISNCGKNLLLVGGGDYTFTHCTIASFSNNFLQRTDPVLLLTNYTNSGSNTLTAVFTNCIFWGEGLLSGENEVVVKQAGSLPFNVSFDHVLWKMKHEPGNVLKNKILTNQEPLFDSINTSKHYYNFLLKKESPAIDAGRNTSITLDIDGNTRPVGLPDIGAYEVP